MPPDDALLSLRQRLDDEQEPLAQALELENAVGVEALGLGAERRVLQREAEREAERDVGEALQGVGIVRFVEHRVEALLLERLAVRPLRRAFGGVLQAVQDRAAHAVAAKVTKEA